MNVHEDEIDIRPYVLAIVRFWWLIGLITIGSLAASFYLVRRQPVAYSSTATILVMRNRASLELAEQFPTRTEPIDPVARMQALISLAEDDSLALHVMQLLGNNLPSSFRSVEALKGVTSVSNSGDTILVTATASDPELATMVANTWAEQAVNMINSAYSGEQPLSEIQRQLQSARIEYDNSQSMLEDFILNSQINILEEKIAEAKVLLTSLLDNRTRQISFYSDRKQKMEILKVQAEALKGQLQKGSQSQAGELGDALAVIIARAKALGVGSVYFSAPPSVSNTGQSSETRQRDPALLPSDDLTLNIQLGDMNSQQDSPSNYVADLDTIIELTNEEIARADEALEILGQEVEKGEGYETIEEVAAQIRGLEMQLESEMSRHRELTSQRDLVWQAYQAMGQKEVELRNTGPTNSQVTVASPAVVPEIPVQQSTISRALVMGGIGMLIAITFILLATWWQSFNRQEVSRPTLKSESTK